jgi:vitamin B12 transporter
MPNFNFRERAMSHSPIHRGAQAVIVSVCWLALLGSQASAQGLDRDAGLPERALNAAPGPADEAGDAALLPLSLADAATAVPSSPSVSTEPGPADGGGAIFPLAPGQPTAPLPAQSPVAQPGVVAPLAPALGPAVDVTVVGSSKAQRTRESAEAVTVVELDVATRQAADLGEVLARMEGINVRRAGGLGSDARFSLNGLTDDQIRFLVDDVPLELAGYPQGFANMPWLMLDHVVVYRGVVPIRFGADALGGALNLVSRQPTRGYGGEASYQVGSFGTHRAALSAFQVHKPTGLYTRLSLYVDSTRNDYEVDVEVADDAGGLTPRRVKRFHDAYRAYGGSAELGFVKRRWAERLVLRVFGMRSSRELQNNQIMTVAYGEARYDRASYGANLRYQQPLTRTLRLDALVGYVQQPMRFIDEAGWVYGWLGERLRPDLNPGETTNKALDQSFWQQSAFARLLLAWTIADGHKLELAWMPTYTSRTGEEHRPLPAGSRDPLRDLQRQLSIVSGLAYELSALDDRVENSLFVKSYVYLGWASQTAPNMVKIDRDTTVTRFGVGDSLRVRITGALYAKGSYEFATRLPRPLEMFGDGVFINPSLALKPESSHNGNLELTLRQDTPRAGQVRASVNGFVRKVRNQILELPARTEVNAMRDFQFQNVYAARSLGAETTVGWTSPRDYVALDANVTYVDLRNDSSKGTFGMYEGDRLPNRPYLFANASGRGTLHSLLRAEDELSLFWYVRYVHDFYRSWESLGLRETKAKIAGQTSHTLGLMYSLALERYSLDSVLEVQNLTDAKLYDNWGAQRPGRAFFFKLSGRR